MPRVSAAISETIAKHFPFSFAAKSGHRGRFIKLSKSKISQVSLD